MITDLHIDHKLLPPILIQCINTAVSNLSSRGCCLLWLTCSLKTTVKKFTMFMNNISLFNAFRCASERMFIIAHLSCAFTQVTANNVTFLITFQNKMSLFITCQMCRLVLRFFNFFKFEALILLQMAIFQTQTPNYEENVLPWTKK